MEVVTQGSLTGLWTAAPLRTAGAPDVTAAGVGAALTPANAQEEEDKEDSQTDDNHKQPVCREMGTGREPGGLGGNRDTDTAGQGRDRWDDTMCKACMGSCRPCWILHARHWGAAAERCSPLYNSGQSQS